MDGLSSSPPWRTSHLQVTCLWLLQEPHCGEKNPQILSALFFFSVARKQHNYSTTAAWFTGWNLFCSAPKWLIVVPLSLLQLKTSSFPPLQLCPKLTYGSFVETHKNAQRREDVCANHWQYPPPACEDTMTQQYLTIRLKIFNEWSRTHMEWDFLGFVFRNFVFFKQKIQLSHLPQKGDVGIKCHLTALKTRRRKKWIFIELVLSVHVQNY